VWLVAILFGFVSVVGGLMISGWYLVKVRPVVTAAERGSVPD
jgi:ABC-type Mn2+/Zn2+ transport system permease subunit